METNPLLRKFMHSEPGADASGKKVPESGFPPETNIGGIFYTVLDGVASGPDSNIVSENRLDRESIIARIKEVNQRTNSNLLGGLSDDDIWEQFKDYYNSTEDFSII
jgi:hypothetical protein